MPEAEKPPRVTVAMDFTDEQMQRFREVAPGYRVERHFPEVPAAVWADTEVLYTIRNFPQPDQAPRLRWIQLHFAGVDAVIDQPIFQAEDITLTNGSGIHTTQIAEYCLGMMLAFTYKIPLMLAHKRESKWAENRYELFHPHPLRGLALGIVGYGTIGRELGRLAAQFGMRVLASKRDLMTLTDEDSYTPPGTGDPNADIPDRLYPTEAVASMARECDFLVLLTPLTDETRKLVSADVLKAMKKTAVLINVARGGVVDEAALVTALQNGQIGGAALDVFEHEPLPPTSPLWTLDNVIISPHIAGNAQTYNEQAAALFAENLRRYVANEPLLNQHHRSRGY